MIDVCAEDSPSCPEPDVDVTEQLRQAHQLLEKVLRQVPKTGLNLARSATKTPPEKGSDSMSSAAGPVIAKLIHQTGHRPMSARAIYNVWPPLGETAALHRLHCELLARRGRVQVLLTQRAIEDGAHTPEIDEFLNQGADVRVLAGTAPTQSILDGVVALIADCRYDGGARLSVVREHYLVSTIDRLYTAAWHESVDLALLRRLDSDWQLDGTSCRVVELLSEGYTDEVAARKLGLSVRTYRRHVADLMQLLGARSRFQAGVLASRHFLPRVAGNQPPGSTDVCSPPPTAGEDRQTAHRPAANLGWRRYRRESSRPTPAPPDAKPADVLPDRRLGAA